MATTKTSKSAKPKTTREALCVSVHSRIGSEDVLETFYRLLMKRGKPEYIRPEFKG